MGRVGMNLRCLAPPSCSQGPAALPLSEQPSCPTLPLCPPALSCRPALPPDPAALPCRGHLLRRGRSSSGPKWRRLGFPAFGWVFPAAGWVFLLSAGFPRGRLEFSCFRLGFPAAGCSRCGPACRWLADAIAAGGLRCCAARGRADRLLSQGHLPHPRSCGERHGAQVLRHLWRPAARDAAPPGAACLHMISRVPVAASSPASAAPAAVGHRATRRAACTPAAPGFARCAPQAFLRSHDKVACCTKRGHGY